MVDHYYTPSQFTREKFIEVGFPAHAISVKPNFISPDPSVGDGDGGFALYVGRLSHEKGIETMLQQWQAIGSSLPLKIVGTGPLESVVANAASEYEAISFEGFQSMPRVLELIGQATCVVMPSLWYETFGRVIIEAFAKGTPVLVTNLGAMAELVSDGETGFRFDPHKTDDLATKVKQLTDNPDLRMKLGEAARLEYETRYTADANYPVLLDIYEQAIAHSLGDSSSIDPATTMI